VEESEIFISRNHFSLDEAQSVLENAVVLRLALPNSFHSFHFAAFKFEIVHWQHAVRCGCPDGTFRRFRLPNRILHAE